MLPPGQRRNPMSTANELRLDISSLHGAYQSGTTVQQMLDFVFERLKAVNDPGIFLHLASREELSQKALELGVFDPVAKPLWGVPFAVKDNIDVQGMPTTAACQEFSYLPSKDATVVALLRAAGAIVIGKTNLDQFATGLVGVRTPFAIPKNAIDPAMIPGGSSSGSAVATAHGIVSFALGTDTAGSGRIPAGLNNIVGLKPSLGALSTSGVVPACRTLDCVSVFALTVSDAYRVFEITAKLDSSDCYSRSLKTRPLSSGTNKLTIGVPAKADLRFFGDELMSSAFESTVSFLRESGHKVIDLPFKDFFATADLLYEGAWVAERFAAIETFMAEHEDAMHPVTRQIIGGGKDLTAVDAFRSIYALRELRAKLTEVIASVDAICVPTAPRHFMVEEVLADPIATNSALGSYTNFVNLLDLCGIAVPAAKRSDGLPMSVTFLAPAGSDEVVSSIGLWVHEQLSSQLGATGWTLNPVSLENAVAAGDEIELVVVGAHLSGMPLNGELVRAGGRYLRSVNTTPDYRLSVLPDQQVQKPGLERVRRGEGASIEVEVWSLPERQFAQFVAAIPAPLGIGTILLADGTAPKGFLVESVAVDSAEDISSFGGWRSYVNRSTSI